MPAPNELLRRLQRECAIVGSELRLFCFTVKRMLSRRALRSDSASLRTEERATFRAELRRVPWWTEGHLLFGMALVEELRTLQQRPDPRDLATISVCAEAANQLMGSHANARRVYVDYLKGMAAFYSGDHAAAQEALEAVTFQTAPEQVAVSALETRAAALMTLGREQEARRCFKTIPSDLRSGETGLAMRYLDLHSSTESGR